MKVGYFLENLQEVDLQADLLNAAGVTTIYSDIATSVDRPGFLQLLADASIGDCIVIPNFAGLGTSLKDLIGRLTEIETHGLSFVTLTDNINSSSPANAFIPALANFDRCRMLARIGHRRKAARACGKVGGRKPVLDDQKMAKIDAAIRSADARDALPSYRSIARSIGASERTVRRYLRGQYCVTRVKTK